MEVESLLIHKVLFWTQVTFLKSNKAGVGTLFVKGLGSEYFRFVGPKFSVDYSTSPSSW